MSAQRTHRISMWTMFACASSWEAASTTRSSSKAWSSNASPKELSKELKMQKSLSLHKVALLETTQQCSYRLSLPGVDSNTTETKGTVLIKSAEELESYSASEEASLEAHIKVGCTRCAHTPDLTCVGVARKSLPVGQRSLSVAPPLVRWPCISSTSMASWS